MARVPTTQIGLVCTVIFSAAAFSCGGRVDLVGDTSKQDTEKDAPSAESRSQADIQKQAPKEEAKAERPAAKPEAPVDPTPPTGDDEATDEDLRIIPPEVVSGAYLTCVGIPPSEVAAPEGYVYVGCATFDKDGKRIDLANVERNFALHDESGAEIQAKAVDLETRSEDIIFQVYIDDFMRGIVGSLTVFDTAGLAQTIECVDSANPTDWSYGQSISISYGSTPSNQTQHQHDTPPGGPYLTTP